MKSLGSNDICQTQSIDRKPALRMNSILYQSVRKRPLEWMLRLAIDIAFDRKKSLQAPRVIRYSTNESVAVVDGADSIPVS